MQRNHFQRSRQTALVNQTKLVFLIIPKNSAHMLYRKIPGNPQEKRPFQGVSTVEVYHAVHGFASIDTASFINYKDCYVQKTIICLCFGNTSGRLRDQPGAAPSHRNSPSNLAAGRYPDGYRLTHCDPFAHTYARSPAVNRRPGVFRRDYINAQLQYQTAFQTQMIRQLSPLLCGVWDASITRQATTAKR